MNEKLQAVALKYDETKAPTVTAKGDGGLAAEIVRIAQETGVPLYENEELVKVLSTLELGEEIPEILYRVIAEIIAFAFYIQGKAPKDFDNAEATKEQKPENPLAIKHTTKDTKQ